MINSNSFLYFSDRSFSKGMDTSEETSDTCVDEHHDISSGPPSGPMEYFAATAGRTPTASRRSRSNHSPSKSPHSWSRRPGDKNLERATR